MEIDMKENGKMIIEKEMERYIFIMVIDMKEKLKVIFMMDMEYFILL